MDLGYRGGNSSIYGSQFSDRKSGSIVSSAVVKLSDDCNVLPAETANMITSVGLQQPLYAGYDYSYADYGQGFGGGAESAGYSVCIAGLNKGTAPDYRPTDCCQYYTQYDASGYGKNYTT